MKKILPSLTLFCIMLVAVLLSSCEKTNTAEPSMPLDMYNCTLNDFDYAGVKYRFTYQQREDLHLLMKTEELNNWGELTAVRKYDYDEYGRLTTMIIEYMNDDSEGVVDVYSTFAYGDNNNLIHVQTSLINDQQVSQRRDYQYMYNRENQLMEQKIYRDFDLEATHKYIYQNEELNQEQVYNPEDILTFTYKYSYDKKNSFMAASKYFTNTLMEDDQFGLPYRIGFPVKNNITKIEINPMQPGTTAQVINYNYQYGAEGYPTSVEKVSGATKEQIKLSYICTQN